MRVNLSSIEYRTFFEIKTMTSMCRGELKADLRVQYRNGKHIHSEDRKTDLNF